MRVGRLRSIRKCSSNANHQCHDRTLEHRSPDGLGTHHEVIGPGTCFIGSFTSSHSRFELALEANPCTLVIIGLSLMVKSTTLRTFGVNSSDLVANFGQIQILEVILQAFDEWGPGCVDRFIGMFAFVIIDEKTRHLHAFRDRSGVKPFFFVCSQRRSFLHQNSRLSNSILNSIQQSTFGHCRSTLTSDICR